ncbi:MAG TPA: DUF5668 domain-containing protein [Candidatus Hydrothermia bacterium]|nr:DUF5668 domain-containing protein [Candidatus Hydrothermia bacterium]HOL24084.1 DUF5668 domain-containing protein [Candidatus Hydrothermia bacterium]HPO78984.1 DUF5668 domain-containing protein [Candidatus Hydrothermia bacterium]
MKMRKGQIWLGVIFVILGAVVLLRNFGILSESAWGYLWRFWPLILVLVGLEILISNKLVRGLIIVAFLLVGIGLLIFGRDGWEQPAETKKEVVQVGDSAINKFIIKEDLKETDALEVICENIRELDIDISGQSRRILDARLTLRPESGDIICADSIEFLLEKTGSIARLIVKDRRGIWDRVNSFVGHKGYEGELQILVPDGIKLTVSNVNGDLNLKDFKGTAIIANIVNGNLDFKEIEVSEVNSEMVNGDITGRNVKASDNIEFSKVNGAWDLDRINSREISISGVNGEVKLGRDLDFENLEVDLINGNITARIGKKWLKGLSVLSTLNGTVTLKKDGVAEIPVYVEKGLKGEEKSDTARKANARILVKTVIGSVHLE